MYIVVKQMMHNSLVAMGFDWVKGKSGWPTFLFIITHLND